MIEISKTQSIAVASRMLAAMVCLWLFSFTADAQGQAKPTENDYYRLINFPVPEDIVLEVGGLGWLDEKKTRLLACTRRGELWVIDNVYTDQPAVEGQKLKVKNEQGKTVEVEPQPEQLVKFTQMLFGLHEPLGMAVNPKGFPAGIYMAQRAELTRVEDSNQDDKIDVVETFNDEWEISGSYHEYAFGPKLDKHGNLLVTLNRPFGGGQEGKALWRSWAVSVDPQGEMHAVCAGLRSPAGLGTNIDGEMFYTDNQGDHVAVCKLSHLKPGSFHGNPIAFDSADHPKSNFKIPFEKYPKKDLLWHEAVQANPLLQAPAVWFPYPLMGKSHTDVLCDTTDGKFGPFATQTFVGDLSTSQVLRCFLEKVDGDYQGAVFPFRRNIGSAVLRMEFGHDGSMFVGGSNRGWGGSGKSYGLNRLVWTGEVPFEIHEMRAKPDGFELTFTQKVDPKTAADVASYSLRCWGYHYHAGYGDKPRDVHPLKITSANVAADGRSVRLVVEGLELGYVHELRAPGVRNGNGQSLLHDDAYYTLNAIPKK